MSARTLVLAFLVAASVVAAGAPAVADSGPQGAIAHDGDQLTLTAGPAVGISGSADLAPGTKVTIIVESQTTPGDPFLLHEETQVDRDGQFYGMFDFSDVPANSTAEVYVMTSYDSVPVASVNATFAECSSFCSDRDARSGVAPDVSGDTLELQDGVTGLTGEPLYLAVGMGDADAATLSVDTGIPGEPLNATLRDNDGDGRVLVELDAAGDRDLWVSAAGDSDSAVVFHDPDVPDGERILDQGTHEARLFRGPDASGSVVDQTSVEISASDSTGGEDQSRQSADGSGVDFEESSVNVATGGTATIPVSMAEDGVATLVVDRDTGYEATVVVTDGNSDGEVAVRLDTAATDGENGFSVVEAADEVAVESVTVPSEAVENESLASGAYTLQVYDGDAAESAPENVARLLVDSERRDTTTGDQSSSDFPVGAVAIGIGGLVAVGGFGVLFGVRR